MRCLRLEIDHVGSYYFMGWCRFYTGHDWQSCFAIIKELTNDSEYEPGDKLRRNGQHNEALAAYTQHLKEDPTCFYAGHDIINLLETVPLSELKTEELQATSKVVRAILEADPRHQDAKVILELLKA
jgi:hypothetical protein